MRDAQLGLPAITFARISDPPAMRIARGRLMSTSTDQFAAMNAPMERRFYPRVTPSAPIYVAFGSNNLGTLLNVSENGFSVGTPNPLDLNSVYRVYLSLDGAASAITVSVRTVWTDQRKIAPASSYWIFPSRTANKSATGWRCKPLETRAWTAGFRPKKRSPPQLQHNAPRLLFLRLGKTN